jgi:hypothetical protein
MTARKGRALGSADDEVADAPDPARLLARTPGPVRVGAANGRSVMSAVAPLPLEANLDALRIDPDTEETPPTAVPGLFRFELDWADEEDDDEAAPPPAPPEDDVAAAQAEAAVVAPQPAAVPFAAPAPAAPLAAPAASEPVPAAPPSSVAPRPAPAKPAASGGMPGWLWLVLGVLLGAGAVGLYLALGS